MIRSLAVKHSSVSVNTIREAVNIQPRSIPLRCQQMDSDDSTSSRKTSLLNKCSLCNDSAKQPKIGLKLRSNCWRGPASKTAASDLRSLLEHLLTRQVLSPQQQPDCLSCNGCPDRCTSLRVLRTCFGGRFFASQFLSGTFATSPGLIVSRRTV